MSKKTYESKKSSAANKLVSEYSYDARGNIEVVKETKTSANVPGAYNYSRQTTYGYDAAIRINSEVTTEDSTPSVNRIYTYYTGGNGFGKVNQIIDNLNGQNTKTFGYNGRGQLSSISQGGVSTEYMYDSYGNLSEKKTGGVREYICGWSRGNLLKSVTKNSTEYGYGYNHKNIRFQKTIKVNGSITATVNFSLDGDRILGEERSDGTKLRYLYDADGLCGFADKNYNAVRYAYVKDSLGNISMITNDNREILALYKYDPDGKCTVCNPNGSPNTSSTFIGNVNPFRWKSFYYDEESGLYYANCRYYDPETRQYIDAAEADVIIKNALELYGLDRNGLTVKTLLAMAPYLAAIYTSEEFSPDPLYSDNRPWWDKHFIQVIINVVNIVVGVIICCTGNPLGLLSIASGIIGLIGLAYSDHIAQALGLSLTAVQAFIASIQLLSKCVSPLNIFIAIVGFISAGACAAFAAAEMQEGITGNNYLRDRIGDGWYTGLMITAQVLAITTVIYNQYGPKCFAAGTLVLTAEGNKKIEEIEVGDMVWAYDEETGISDWKPVIQLFRNRADRRTHLEFDCENEPIICTPEHPFFILNATADTPIVRFEGCEEKEAKSVGKWVAAKYLKIGDNVLLASGKIAIITKAETEKCEPFTTYNFEVAASLITGRPENNDKTIVFEGSRNHLTANNESEPKEKTGGWGWRKVTRVFRNTTTEWVHVDVNGEDITCTGEHPFYVLNSTADTPIVNFEGRDDSKYAGQWVAAKNLKAGHEFLLSNGETATVQKITIEHLDEPQVTYNLEVEGAHTYCVGKNGILVHNACPVGPELPDEGIPNSSALRKDVNGKIYSAKTYGADGRVIARVDLQGTPHFAPEVGARIIPHVHSPVTWVNGIPKDPKYAITLATYIGGL